MKKAFLLLLYFCSDCYSQSITADSVIAFAKSQIGTKYCYGNCTPKSGFDCSGFVYYVFGHFDIKVPRASMDYEKKGMVISSDSAKPGDIIVFTGTNIKNRKPGHVGIVLSHPGEDMQFIHCSSGKKANGVVISSYLNSPYYKKRFIKIVRIADLNY